MSNVITFSIDVTGIDKKKLVKGKKVREDKTVGVYGNFALIPTPGGQYGDFMVVQEQTKEERAAKKKSVILGNAKFLKKKDEASESTEGSENQDHEPAPF